MTDIIDVIVPRGGKGSGRAGARKARVPVLPIWKASCHSMSISADPPKALNVVLNAKTRRTGFAARPNAC